jgi:hypothetical protein
MAKQPSYAVEKKVKALTLALSEDQKQQIASFWRETGSLGSVELLVDVVNDRISPASIQVGTAK